MSSPSLLLFLLFYSSVSPPTSPLCFANLVLLILPPHLPFQYFGIFSPYLLRSYTLFSSSSSAAECCPSYLCSRLGMFFLLMRSILSLPSHHLLFSVWAACVSYLSPLPILGYCRRFTGGGNGLEVGLCHDWLKSSIERVSWDAWCCLAGEPVHLFVHSKQLLGDGEWSCCLAMVKYWCFQNIKATESLCACRVSEQRFVCFLSAAMFWVHIEVASAWLNASQGTSRLRSMHDNPVTPSGVPAVGHIMMLSIHPSIRLTVCLSILVWLAQPLCSFKGSVQPKQKHIFSLRCFSCSYLLNRSGFIVKVLGIHLWVFCLYHNTAGIYGKTMF